MIKRGFVMTLLASLLTIQAAYGDETCMSPYMAKIGPGGLCLYLDTGS